MENGYVLTGAPGGGKTAILRELAGMGFAVVAEPAREVLAEQRAAGGNGVPERNPGLFCELMLAKAVAQFRGIPRGDRPVFFDRGIPDMIGYARLFGVPESAAWRAAREYRYNALVFVTPSWEEIYGPDDERKMSFEAARDFGEELRSIYAVLGYSLIEVPHGSLRERAEFVALMVT